MRLEHISRIGLFWLVPLPSFRERLVGLSRLTSAVPTIAGFKTLDEGHVDVWPQIVRRFPHLRGSEYEDHPRGRVNWDEVGARYILLADRRIITSAAHDRIMRAWHLPRGSTWIDRDLHYRTR